MLDEYTLKLIDNMRTPKSKWRSNNHDQRLGQWLINKIRFNNPKYKHIKDLNIEGIIFNMENQEFIELLGDYDK